MADFSWLRLGQRPRTPSASRTTVSPERRPSQVPSHLNLTNSSSYSPDILTGSNDAGLLIREQDKIWYNPSLDQMVEALQVLIMTRGVLCQIPVEYNSYVLHLIEGFANAQERVRAIDTARVEAKHSLEHHLEHFKSVADEWLERESQYKNEIKRLEVLLSRTSCDGLEAVTLARTNSVVDRNGPQAKKFVSKLKLLSTRTTQEVSIDPLPGTEEHASKPEAKVLDEDNDFLMSEKIRRYDATMSASIVHPRGRRPRYMSAAASALDKYSSAKEVEAEKRSALTNKAEVGPLFSDDISDRPITDSKLNVRAEEPLRLKRQARGRIQDNLLDCETSQNSVKGDFLDANDLDESLGSYSPREESDDTNIHDRNFRHLRGLSGFSFMPGDDVSPILTSYRCHGETMEESVTEEDGGCSVGQSDYKLRHRKENLVHPMGDPPTVKAATLGRPSKSQWLERALPQGSCGGSPEAGM